MKFKTTKITKGWGLLQKNGWMRAYSRTDGIGILAGQIALWRTRKEAKAMALPGEYAKRIRVMYVSD